MPPRADEGVGADEPSVGPLLELAVADLALIERVRLPFAPGFNVLTGETGAGKSLLIDALGLATGARADSSLVRHGADAAGWKTLFDRAPEPLICVREVSASGRSTARIDDQTVTAARLGEVAAPLVEIHGQHEQQRLLDERTQRDLDAYGDHEALRAAMAAAVGRWQDNCTALASSRSTRGRLPANWQFIGANPRRSQRRACGPENPEEIRARLEATQHGETIARLGGGLHEALVGEPGGARDSVAEATQSARQLGRLDRRYERLADRLAGVEAELSDIAEGSPGTRRGRGPRSARVAGAGRTPLADLCARATIRRRRAGRHRLRRAGNNRDQAAGGDGR